MTTRYCPGVTGIDTVVHEWSHAYIQEAAGLIYLYQSGALNGSSLWFPATPRLFCDLAHPPLSFSVCHSSPARAHFAEVLAMASLLLLDWSR